MKKILLSIAFAVVAAGAFSQNRLVKKAQTLTDENKLDEAQTVFGIGLVSVRIVRLADVHERPSGVRSRDDFG